MSGRCGDCTSGSAGVQQGKRARGSVAGAAAQRWRSLDASWSLRPQTGRRRQRSSFCSTSICLRRAEGWGGVLLVPSACAALQRSSAAACDANAHAEAAVAR